MKARAASNCFKAPVGERAGTTPKEPMKMHSTWLVHVSPVPCESGSRPGLQARWAHPCRTLRHAFSAMLTRRRNRRAAFEVYALDDHHLRDIGLSRHEVTEAILLGRLPSGPTPTSAVVGRAQHSEVRQRLS